MAQPAIYQWHDFGNGQQILTSASLKIMRQRDVHLLRVFSADGDDVPIGLVALSNIAPCFKTATVWYVLGNKAYARQGYTTLPCLRSSASASGN